MTVQASQNPDKESVRLAMDLAWRDHHHAREQTWKALEIEVALAVGLVGVDWRIGSVRATVAAGILVAMAAISGILISLHHRRLEIRKFIHILNCEEFLGLHRDDLLPHRTVTLPKRIRLVDVIHPGTLNTAVFILRMHITIVLFAIVFVYARWKFGFPH